MDEAGNAFLLTTANLNQGDALHIDYAALRMAGKEVATHDMHLGDKIYVRHESVENIGLDCNCMMPPAPLAEAEAEAEGAAAPLTVVAAEKFDAKLVFDDAGYGHLVATTGSLQPGDSIKVDYGTLTTGGGELMTTSSG